MSKKLFAFDVDGTIYSTNSQMLDETKDALKEAKKSGHLLVLSSGRSYSEMQEPLTQVPHGTFDYLVCNNGAYVYDLKTNKEYYDSTIDPKSLKIVLDFAKTIKGLVSVSSVNETSRTLCFDIENGPSWWTDEKDSWLRWGNYVTESEIIDFANKNLLLQIAIRANFEEVKKLKKILDNKVSGIETHIANDAALDIAPANISKKVGLEKVLEIQKDVDVKDVYTFGDSSNDLQMLEWSGHSYAMGNANEEAKKVAKETIGANNTPAIANVILKNI